MYSKKEILFKELILETIKKPTSLLIKKSIDNKYSKALLANKYTKTQPKIVEKAAKLFAVSGTL